MLAMQYTIHLPEDYDMQRIESRVEERKALFDAVPGLVHKNYLANHKDKIYAPFYIWDDITKMRDFLMDDLFHGVTTSFSRPRVRTWAVLNQQRGIYTGQPCYAVREADSIVPEEPLEALFDREKKHQETLLQNPNLFHTVVGLDADRWEVLRYNIWKDEDSAAPNHGDTTQTYTVLHV
ncbi:MAG: DUF4865 family protein [Alphaproteobacteria bacterium]|nr:DUF4865 family protein [Alphaproteobacteria bacterium]